jgi:hypothetical protein
MEITDAPHLKQNGSSDQNHRSRLRSEESENRVDRSDGRSRMDKKNKKPEANSRPIHTSRHVTGNQITAAGDVDSTNQSSMSENLSKLRLRAKSCNEKEETVETGLIGRAWSIGSSHSEKGAEDQVWSIGSEGIVSPAHVKNGAPMVREVEN